MPGKSGFTPDEWEALRKGVTGAGLLVAVSDRGFFDSFKEAGALGKHLATARENSARTSSASSRRNAAWGSASEPGRKRSSGRRSSRFGPALLRSRRERRTRSTHTASSSARSLSRSRFAAGDGEASESQTIEKVESALA